MFIDRLRALATAGFVLVAMPGLADEVTVFAAASLKNAMEDIAASFNDATGHDLALSLAGSSALARQIQQGAPADVFISANPNWMDTLEEEGAIRPDTRFDLLANAIVLVGSGAQAGEPAEIGPEFDLTGLLGDGHLAMALVDAVPAGIYGKASLETLGFWSHVEPQVAQADNVRAALALVATGEAPLGIVYASDARAEPRVSVIALFPEDSHPPIIYPAAQLTESDSPAAAAFLDFLTGPEAREAFLAQGFSVLVE